MSGGLESLLSILGKLKAEVPEVARSLDDLAAVLGTTTPAALRELFARFLAMASTGSYKEFDAAVRESYPSKDAFAAAFAQYERARQVRGCAFQLGQLVGYLADACQVDAAIERDRVALLGSLKLESLLRDPSVISAHEETVARWKESYVQAYRKAHRDFYESTAELAAALDPQQPKARALARMNAITELGPPTISTESIEAHLEGLKSEIRACPDAAEADVAGNHALCPRCPWRPGKKPPADALSRLEAAISLGLADRFQRFKDTAIAQILKKAADEQRKPGLRELLDVIQIADADRLSGVLNDDLVAFLRRLLYDENLVDEQIPLRPILQQVGAIDAGRVEESISTLGKLLKQAIDDAKAKHGPSKRVRVFLTLDTPGGESGGPSGTTGQPGGAR